MSSFVCLRHFLTEIFSLFSFLVSWKNEVCASLLAILLCDVLCGACLTKSLTALASKASYL